MVKYSDSSDYELVELESVFDLRNARIVRGSIVDIDRPNNQAQVSLASECPDITADMSQVKFWYHCEDSTGTLEDLEEGHLAFRNDDDVYLLFVPASDQVEQRLYIVGHADIRGTKTCKSHDIILISMVTDANPLGWSSTGGIWWEPAYWGDGDMQYPVISYVSMFDTGTGAKVDPLSVPLFDENSPPPPSSFPCLSDQAFIDWLEYNFDASISPYIVNITSCESFENSTRTAADNENQPGPDHYSIRGWNYADGSSTIESYHGVAGLYTETPLPARYCEKDELFTQDETIVAGHVGVQINYGSGQHFNLSVSRELHTLESGYVWGCGAVPTHNMSSNYTLTISEDFHGFSEQVTSGMSSWTIEEGGIYKEYRGRFETLNFPVWSAGGEVIPCGCVWTHGNEGFYFIAPIHEEGLQDDFEPRNYVTWNGQTQQSLTYDNIYYGMALLRLGLYQLSEIERRDPRLYIHGLGYANCAFYKDIPEAYIQGSTISAIEAMARRNRAVSRGLEQTYGELKRLIFNSCVDRGWSWRPPRLTVYKVKEPA